MRVSAPPIVWRHSPIEAVRPIGAAKSLYHQKVSPRLAAYAVPVAVIAVCAATSRKGLFAAKTSPIFMSAAARQLVLPRP